MASLVKDKQTTYNKFFYEMNRELSCIRRNHIYTRDIESLRSLKAYWNSLVKCLLKWREESTKQLSGGDLVKFLNYVRRRLLDECDVVIRESQKFNFSRSAQLAEKREFVSELEDRKIFIRLKY